MGYFRAFRLVLAGLGVALTAWTAGATGSSVTLAWNSSTTPDIAGYRIYVGGVSQNYTNVVDVGNTNSATVTGLVPGATYFFAATAYDSLGLESPFSGEIMYVVPFPRAKMQLSLLPFGQILLSGTAPSGYYYEVQTSTDLVNWSTLGGVVADTGGFLTFIDPLGLTGVARWYRLRQSSP